jgi:nucleoside phosphorylase
MMRGSMTGIEPPRSESGSSPRTFGLIAAMPEELGAWPPRAADRHTRLGLEVLRFDVGGFRVLACVSGIGKVLSARAAVVLLSEGVDRGLLVVGTCGGLRQSLAPGTLLHCTTAAQVDLAHRRSRENAADPELRAAWRSVAPGPEGWFLTADRPVLSLVKRIRLARAFAGPCAADMETAAVAAVAAEGGIPFAGLRAVTDRATLFAAASFRANYRTHAGKAADTVSALLGVLEEGARVSHSRKPPVP